MMNSNTHTPFKMGLDAMARDVLFRFYVKIMLTKVNYDYSKTFVKLPRMCFCHFLIWCSGSGVVFDCIDS